MLAKGSFDNFHQNKRQPLETGEPPHRFFATARLDLEIEDRFRPQARPKKWFFVPLQAIEEIVEKSGGNQLQIITRVPQLPA